ncbi:MAG: hypothetical protein PHS44_08370 [Candidatus Dojkabacteria bacterium]|nr:hypothetical protein [Candidatus Dojkabacteria bacterium]
MDNKIKGQILDMSFEGKDKKFELSAVLPENWNVKTMDEGKALTLSEGENKVRIILFSDKNNNEIQFPTHSDFLSWYKFILDDFVPEGKIYASVALSAFTSELLGGKLCFCVVFADEDSSLLRKRYYLVLSEDDVLHVDCQVENSQKLDNIVENIVLGIGEKDAKRDVVG